MDGGKTEPEVQLLIGMETRKQQKLVADATTINRALIGTVLFSMSHTV